MTNKSLHFLLSGTIEWAHPKIDASCTSGCFDGSTGFALAVAPGLRAD